jgi:hypothetical protein
VLDAVLPVAQVDKHWQSDRLNIWGAFGQSFGDAVNHQAVGLLAGNREVLVHKVEAWVDLSLVGGDPFHMFTPLQGYDSFAIAPVIFLPWLQMGYEGPVQAALLPQAFLLAGRAAALQTILVNGVPFTTIGPSYQHMIRVTSGATRTLITLWSMQDPPLRLLPQQQLVVQSATVWPLGRILDVNFYFSEREAQGSVG